MWKKLKIKTKLMILMRNCENDLNFQSKSDKQAMDK